MIKPGHKKAMCRSKDMDFINKNPRAPGIVVGILDQHLPRVELGLGAGAAHNVVVQFGLIQDTVKICYEMYQNIIIFTDAHMQG